MTNSYEYGYVVAEAQANMLFLCLHARKHHQSTCSLVFSAYIYPPSPGSPPPPAYRIIMDFLYHCKCSIHNCYDAIVSSNHSTDCDGLQCTSICNCSHHYLTSSACACSLTWPHGFQSRHSVSLIEKPRVIDKV